MLFKLLRAAPLFGASMALLLATSAPVAAQGTGQSGWQSGPGGAGGNTYEGYIDGPANGSSAPAGSTFLLHGWFVDTTAQGWAGADQMQVYSGSMGSGGTQLVQGIVGESRPDVAAATGNPYWTNSGFSAQVPTRSLSGSQTLNVYLHTPGKGWWFEPLTINVTGAAATTSAPAASAPAPAPAAAPAGNGTATGAPQVVITQPTEGENVYTNSMFTIQGTATEPGIGPSDIDSVTVYLDGEQNTGSLLGTTTPASDGSWSVTFSPTKYPSTHSNVYVYAHSKSTGQTTETIRGFNITDRT